MAELSDKTKIPKPKQFYVHFGSQIVIGKSYVRIGLPLGIPYTVTGKFYSKEANQYSYENQLNKLIYLEPRQKYDQDQTENQRYGWYQERFTDLDKSDKRLHFAKHIDQMIKLQIVTAEKKTK